MTDKTVIEDLNTYLSLIRTIKSKLGKSYYVYAIRCADNSIYVGKTNSPTRRLLEHIEGKTSINYKIHPDSLVYLESFTDPKQCSKAEYNVMKILNIEQFNNTYKGNSKKRYEWLDDWNNKRK